jgi:hypothetical protein
LENIRTSLDSSWYLSETITCAEESTSIF